MRKGFDSAWIFDDNHNMIAINLGSDFCSEHEWSIKGLNQTLGMSEDDNILGIERYRVTTPYPESIILFEPNKNEAGFIIVESDDVKYIPGKKLDDIARGELSICKEAELATAWCDSSLGVRVKKPKNIKHLQRIYKAILNKDAAVWFGGGHVFKNAGLVIGIISAIGDKSKSEMYNAHLDQNNLRDASEKINIKQKIDVLNKEWYKNNNGAYYAPFGYYALRPAWISGKESAYNVMYWLNPREQKKNQAGWYTVENLLEWLEGKGPVLSK